LARGTLTAFSIGKTVNLLGREKSREIMQLQGITAIAPHWLETSPEALTALVKSDPLGYYVYAAAKCMKFDGPYTESSESKNIFQYAYNLEKQAAASSRYAIKKNLSDSNQYADAEKAADNAAKKSITRLEKSNIEKWDCHLIRRNMYAALASGRISIELVIHANELMRRVLSLSHPRALPNGEWLSLPMLACLNNSDMQSWINAMRRHLKQIIMAYLAKNYEKAKDIARKKTFTWANVIGLQKERGGLSCFSKQKSIHSVCEHEAALIEIDALDLFDGEKDNFRIRLKARARTDTREKTKTAEERQKYSGTPQQSAPTTGFRLNIKPKT
jgi:hypothetical protein